MTKNKNNITLATTAALTLARATDTLTLCKVADRRIAADADAIIAACAVLHERGETLASMMARLA